MKIENLQVLMNGIECSKGKFSLNLISIEIFGIMFGGFLGRLYWDVCGK
jgi:hypothetical protein